MTRLISPSRQVAFDVLYEVASGAYASDALLSNAVPLDPRDAALAHQIVFGSLRFQKQLDFLIGYFARRDPSRLDQVVLIALRAAVFQLRYLERVPAHAAVHDSVEWIKGKARSASGLVNAILRKVNRQPVQWPDRSTRLSCPEWLLASWDAHFGREAAERIAEAALEEPRRYVRMATADAEADPKHFEPTSVEKCFRLTGQPPAGMRLQDISSQAIVPLLELMPGLTYLDLCAAPGNKTLQALETPLRLAVACDISTRRITSIPSVCPRVVLDATQQLPFEPKFDRVLIDAPCSGTGTLGRNPEIKWRVEKEDLGRFQSKQVAILREAANVLAPGGKLVYATCSLQREENEGVIAAALDGVRGLRVETDVWRVPGRHEGDGFYAARLVLEPCWKAQKPC
ncbi:MAG: hypothetical protein JO061_06495 [Acidobacteriaceae bacterium]|nr:hypothetical protein [Acidobacteriaceae bacterium]